MIRSSISISLLLILSVGCITESMGFKGSMRNNLQMFSDDQVLEFEPLGPRYNVDPPLDGAEILMARNVDLENFDPFKKYSAQTYISKGADGMITRHYYLPQGRGKSIAKLLVGHVPGLSYFAPTKKDATINDAFNQNKMGANQVFVALNAIIDKRESAQVHEMKGFSAYAHKTNNVSDLMLVTVKEKSKLMEVDSFLTSLLTELPMIEIKVKVIEIAMSDSFQWGLESIISRLTSSNKSFLKEWFNFFNTQSMTNVGNDPADFQGSLFNAFGVHDKFQLDSTFELLQRITDSDILSAPTLAVLNGHRAIIETGDQVPKQSIVSTATTAFYTYAYEQTGVTLVIVPYLLPGGVIEVNVNAEVRAVTGRETFDTPVGPLSQPILSKRYASTRVQIKEGQAFTLGGLMSSSDFEVTTKLPLLGDIPILGYLFKSKNIEKRKSQIIFYIEPRVVHREDGWRKGDE